MPSASPLADQRLVGHRAPGRDLPEGLNLQGIEVDGQVPKAACARSEGCDAPDLTDAKSVLEKLG